MQCLAALEISAKMQHIAEFHMLISQVGQKASDCPTQTGRVAGRHLAFECGTGPKQSWNICNIEQGKLENNGRPRRILLTTVLHLGVDASWRSQLVEGRHLQHLAA